MAGRSGSGKTHNRKTSVGPHSHTKQNAMYVCSQGRTCNPRPILYRAYAAWCPCWHQTYAFLAQGRHRRDRTQVLAHVARIHTLQNHRQTDRQTDYQLHAYDKEQQPRRDGDITVPMALLTARCIQILHFNAGTASRPPTSCTETFTCTHRACSDTKARSAAQREPAALVGHTSCMLPSQVPDDRGAAAARSALLPEANACRAR